MLLADSTYARPVNIACLYHVTGSVPLAVEPSLLHAQRSGTLYRTISETRLSAAAASGNYLRRTSSTVTQHTQRSRILNTERLLTCLQQKQLNS